MRHDGRVTISRALVPALALVVLLAGCGAPDSGGGGGGEPDPLHDPWLVDDPDTGAAVVTGQFMGVDLLGFTCDVSQFISASSKDDAVPSAYAGASGGYTTVDYQEENLASTAQGTVTLPDSVPATFEISTTKGTWDIGDGGTNDPWSPSVTLTLTEVPVPIDGCGAAGMLGEDLIGADATAQEIIDAFTEVGLRDVSKECPDAWFTWVPPNMTCEEYDARS